MKNLRSGFDHPKTIFIGGRHQHWEDYLGKISILSHVVDKHECLDDPLFNKCAHGDLIPKRWLLSGMFKIMLKVLFLRKEI